MTFDRRHVLAQWGGTLPGGEIWSNSLRLCSSSTGAAADVPTHGEMVSWCEGPAKDALAAFHTNGTAYIANNARLVYLKMNVVDMSGHYTDQNTVEYEWTSPPYGGSSSSAIPPLQICQVVSLTTEFSRGYAHRGRFYLPLPTSLPDPATGLISAAAAMSVATAAATFVEDLADEPGLDLPTGLRVCVMSRHGTGATNLVTGVEVGRVLDTQRRRRNALVEEYQHAAVDQGGS